MMSYRLVLLVILITCTLVDALNKCPYETLGVSRRASDDEIKKQYKRLAKEWHPDRNESPSAAERFMQIQEAYDVSTTIACIFIADSVRQRATVALRPHRFDGR